MRGLLTGEDRAISNMLLEFLAMVGLVLLLVPGWVLHLALVIHVFTTPLRGGRTKAKILRFLRRVWATIPPSPVVDPLHVHDELYHDDGPDDAFL